jgi:hypothetical protein
MLPDGAIPDRVVGKICADNPKSDVLVHPSGRNRRYDQWTAGTHPEKTEGDGQEHTF